jgi:hypothetical protein
VRRMIRGVRRLLAVFALGTILCATGCGGSHPAASATTTTARVVNGVCQSDSLRGQAASQSCTFVLSDGEQFSCGKPFAGHAPAAAQLERAGCRRLPSLKLSSAERALIVRIGDAQTCLTAKGLRATGGPLLPSSPPGGTVLPSGPPGSTQPGGELVLTSAHPTFIAFYASAAQAARIEPALSRADSSSHVEVEAHGAETVIWSHAPPNGVRNMVSGCLPQ